MPEHLQLRFFSVPLLLELPVHVCQCLWGYMLLLVHPDSWIQACGCSTWNQLVPSRVYMCRGSEFWLTQAEWATLVWAPHTKGLSCLWVTCGSSQAHAVCAVIPVGCRLACAEPAQVCVCAGAALEKWLPLVWFISVRGNCGNLGTQTRIKALLAFLISIGYINNLVNNLVLSPVWLFVTPLWSTLMINWFFSNVCLVTLI